jgi:hypothetical protein
VRHTFRVRCLAALSAGRDSFLVSELVGGSGGVCGLATSAGEGTLLGWVHSGEPVGKRWTLATQAIDYCGNSCPTPVNAEADLQQRQSLAKKRTDLLLFLGRQ